jgi:hypothetical protein
MIALIFSVIFLAIFPSFNDMFRSQQMYGTFTNDTGMATGSPVSLSSGTNTITVTNVGDFTVNIISGTAIAADGVTGRVAGSPQSLIKGLNTVAVNPVGDITVTVTGLLPISGGIIAFMPYALVFGAILIIIIIIQSRIQS